MKKIIFFDIDGTLFNPELFLDNFYSRLLKTYGLDESNKEKLHTLYQKVRNENGYFIPSLFLQTIANEFSNIPTDKLEEIFWDIDLYKQSLYKDSLVIKNLASTVTLGVFSKGDNRFQEEKLKALGNYFDPEMIYIFPNKLEKISDVLNKNKDSQNYFVDDSPEVLLDIKNIDSNCTAILIDRSQSKEDNKEIIRINDLNQIINLT